MALEKLFHQFNIFKIRHCVKSLRIRSFSGPYFSAFGLTMKIYPVNLRILSECGKIETRKAPNADTCIQFPFTLDLSLRLP